MIEVIDNFLPNVEAVRASALRSGFGTWRPNKGDIGAESYGGVNFVGDHATPMARLQCYLGRQIIPTSMFFRITNPSMEKALIHSDREYGQRTAIIYLSPSNPVKSGTGFYQHHQSGTREMPPLEEMMRYPKIFEDFKRDMFDESAWDMYKFVEAKYNRCVLFDAPLIHCRIPNIGYGTEDGDSRMVWVMHWNYA